MEGFALSPRNQEELGAKGSTISRLHGNRRDYVTDLGKEVCWGQKVDSAIEKCIGPCPILRQISLFLVFNGMEIGNTTLDPWQHCGQSDAGYRSVGQSKHLFTGVRPRGPRCSGYSFADLALTLDLLSSRLFRRGSQRSRINIR